jgi:hypothetical protein
MGKNQIIWTDVMVRDLLNEIRTVKGHLKTIVSQEEKFKTKYLRIEG